MSAMKWQCLKYKCLLSWNAAWIVLSGLHHWLTMIFSFFKPCFTKAYVLHVLLQLDMVRFPSCVHVLRSANSTQKFFPLQWEEEYKEQSQGYNNSPLWEAPTQPVLTGTHLHRNAMYCKDKENELLSFSRRGSIPRHKEQCEQACIAASPVPVLWLQQCFSTFIPCVPSLRDTVRKLSLSLSLQSYWWHMRWLSLAAMCPFCPASWVFHLSPTTVFLEEFQPQCCCRLSWLYV